MAEKTLLVVLAFAAAAGGLQEGEPPGAPKAGHGSARETLKELILGSEFEGCESGVHVLIQPSFSPARAFVLCRASESASRAWYSVAKRPPAEASTRSGAEPHAQAGGEFSKIETTAVGLSLKEYTSLVNRLRRAAAATLASKQAAPSYRMVQLDGTLYSIRFRGFGLDGRITVPDCEFEYGGRCGTALAEEIGAVERMLRPR